MKSLILTAVIALSAASAAAQSPNYVNMVPPAHVTILTSDGTLITIMPNPMVREYRPMYQVPEYRPAPPVVYENLPPTFGYNKPEPRKSLRCDPCSVTTPKN
jgi:hypothetical protein